jgi:hypothetical protein
MANRFANEMKRESEVLKQQKIEAAALEIETANKKIVEDTAPNTIVETVKDVKDGSYRAVKLDGDVFCGVSGNYVSKVVNINGKMCYVCGANDKELAEDEEHIRISLARGDVNVPNFYGLYVSGRYIMQLININGSYALTIGRNEEERKEDEMKARICQAKLRNAGFGDIITAEELIEVGLKPTKEFEKDGYRYIYFEDQKCARSFDGEKVADISDIKDKLSVDTAIELLKGRIQTPIYEDYDEDDYDEDYEDEDYEKDDYDII